MTDRASFAEISQSRPAKGEAGRTGDWRAKRPVLDAATCSAAKQGRESCQICWVYCPDSSIARGVPPVIDLEYCKGCGICAEVCPTHSIAMVPEAAHGVCEMPGGERDDG
jgi:pyruvate ferredoxin oxidoreductase delta subunit